MTALKVIGVILLIVFLIGLIRVGAVVRFGEELGLTLLIGPFRLTLLPAKETNDPKDGEEKKKKDAEKGKIEQKGKKKDRSLPKLTRDEWKDLIKTALAALK